MGTLNEDLTGIKAVEDKLTANKVANFAYTDHAYNNPLTEADGVTVYDVNHEQNIPVADPTVLNVNETVLSKGWRSQASAITRMLMNHFLGRVSYNLNKLNDNFSATLATIMSHLGQPNGIATLDANGRIPYAQLPESAIEYKGNWNASTNTPTLVNGTGTKGDFYICNVAGTVDFGDGAISFLVNDRVIYDGTVWSKLSAGEVRTVNNKSPDPATGNVQLAKGDIGLGSVANTGDSANASSGGTTKFTTGGAYKLLTSLAPIFSASTAYAVGTFVTYQNALYECTTAHSAGAWNASHFTARNEAYILNNYILPSLAPAFNVSTAYAVGQFVIYQNKLYKCTAVHSAEAWNVSHFTQATLNDITANNLINLLPEETSNPQDADYFISQTAGGGSSTTTYKRRAVSKIWDYIKGKLTGAISTVLTSNLTANKIVGTNDNGKLQAIDAVTGVKGNSETSYRTGNVNITKSNIGLSNVVNTGDSATPVSGGTTKFTTGGAYTELAKKVDKTTTVNGHALSSNVTVSKSDVGLDSVVNTGDSATPASGGATKFTTGGAYSFFGGNIRADAWLGKVFGWALGKKWTKAPNTSYIFKTVCGRAGLWVAGGDSQGFWWSTDGKAWTQVSMGTFSVNVVYFSAGIWVAGSASRGIWYSSDGKAWTQGAGSMTSYDFNTVYNGNIWVAGSDTHGLWWSTNGKAWTQGTGAMTSQTILEVYYDNGIWVAGSDTHGLWWSTDGKAWTQGAGGIDSYTFRTVYYANGIWVAGSVTHGLWWSTDGKAWTHGAGGIASYTFNTVYCINGIWVAGSSYQGLWYSDFTNADIQ